MKAILRLTYLCLSLLFLSLTASAQDVQVKGQVVDDKGEAVIGASVKVKETPQASSPISTGISPSVPPRMGTSSSPASAIPRRP